MIARFHTYCQLLYSLWAYFLLLFLLFCVIVCKKLFASCCSYVVVIVVAVLVVFVALARLTDFWCLLFVKFVHCCWGCSYYLFNLCSLCTCSLLQALLPVVFSVQFLVCDDASPFVVVVTSVTFWWASWALYIVSEIAVSENTVAMAVAREDIQRAFTNPKRAASKESAKSNPLQTNSHGMALRVTNLHKSENQNTLKESILVLQARHV